MKVRTTGHVCLLCGKEIKPHHNPLNPGEEVYKVHGHRGSGAPFFVHVECYAAYPKRGDRA